MNISGSIFAAILTPFGADEKINVNAVPALIDYILSKGVHGLYVGGSSGEAMLQSQNERLSMLEAVADYAKDKCSLIAHVGATSTGEAISLANFAKDKGYHAVSAVPPYYYKHSFADISDYYKSISDAANLPLIIYNIPALSGTNISIEKLSKLMEDDRIIGVKFTATDLFQFSQLRASNPSKLFYFGTDEMFLGAAAIGTDGGIGSTYNLIGDAYVGIQKQIKEGNIEQARILQQKANSLIEVLLDTGVIPGLKHALNYIGVPVGHCRRPFSKLSSASMKKLERWVDINC